jgi:hypothetical protein
MQSASVSFDPWEADTHGQLLVASCDDAPLALSELRRLHAGARWDHRGDYLSTVLADLGM